VASCAAIFGNRHLYVWDVEQPLWGPHYCYQPITSLDVLGSRVHGFVGRNSTPDFDGPSSFPHFQRDPAMIFVKYFSSFMWKLYNSYSYYISIILVISIYIYTHCIYTYLYKHRGLTIAFPWWFPRGFDRGKLTVSELENHHFILGNRWTTWTIFNSTPIIELTLISHGPKKNLHEIAMKNSQAEKNIIIYIYIYIYLHYRLDFSIIYIYTYIHPLYHHHMGRNPLVSPHDLQALAFACRTNQLVLPQFGHLAICGFCGQRWRSSRAKTSDFTCFDMISCAFYYDFIWFLYGFLGF